MYLKHYYAWYLAAAVFFCLLAPFIMGMDALGQAQTGQALDYYFSILGIILITPLFIPEQNREVKDLVSVRAYPMWKLYLFRLGGEGIILAILSLLVLSRFWYGECTFPFLTYFFCSLANSMFLGGLGIFSFGLSGSLPASYMIPFLFYVCNFGAGKDYLGPFYLFSLAQGNQSNKIWLGIVGLFLSFAGIWSWCKRKS